MANVIVRLIRVLPVLLVFAVVVAVVYFFLMSVRTRDVARRVSLRIVSVTSGVATVFFALATVYALFEQNVYVREVADVCALLFGLVFVAAYLGRRRMDRTSKATYGSSDASGKAAAQNPEPETPEASDE